jgi:hypothetical protein
MLKRKHSWQQRSLRQQSLHAPACTWFGRRFRIRCGTTSTCQPGAGGSCHIGDCTSAGTEGTSPWCRAGCRRHRLSHRRAHLCAPFGSNVLHYIMTHELGHILLGRNAHSIIGIMRPILVPEEWEKAERGAFVFTCSQNKQIRTWIEQRSRRQFAAGVGSYAQLACAWRIPKSCGRWESGTALGSAFATGRNRSL